MGGINSFIENDARLTEAKINEYFADTDADCAQLYNSMKYSLQSGGKRVRPFLTIEFCRMAGGDINAALPFAAAIEMIHTFSLIHDDLPCMDNDDLRRGVPTNHKVYGEAVALIAGDALIFSAYDILLSNKYADIRAVKKAAEILSNASGARGMCGGQILDMQGEEKKLSQDELKKLHLLKTGALIRCAAMLGIAAAGGDDNLYKAADEYGKNVGLAFQIIDDILDKSGDEKLLGKNIGSDEKNGKTTFMSFMSADEAFENAKRLTEKAKAAISGFENSGLLCEFADMLLARNK